MKRKKINDKSLKQARDALVKWFINHFDDNTRMTSGQIRACFFDYLSMLK